MRFRRRGLSYFENDPTLHGVGSWRWVKALGRRFWRRCFLSLLSFLPSSPPSPPLSSSSLSPPSPPSPSPPLRGGRNFFFLALGGGITALGHIGTALGGVGSNLGALGDSVVGGVGSEAGSVPGRWVADRGVGWRWVALGAVGCRGGDEVGRTIDMGTSEVLAGYLEAVGACWRGVGSTVRSSNEVGDTLQQVALHVRDHGSTFRCGLLRRRR